jgi:hypothetical protein
MVVHVILMRLEEVIMFGVQIMERVHIVVNVGVNVLCLINV